MPKKAVAILTWLVVLFIGQPELYFLAMAFHTTDMFVTWQGISCLYKQESLLSRLPPFMGNDTKILLSTVGLLFGVCILKTYNQQESLNHGF